MMENNTGAHHFMVSSIVGNEMLVQRIHCPLKVTEGKYLSWAALK